MTVIQKSQVVPYTPAQMYHLVDAIEAYPEFVPWCTKTEILSRDEDEVRAKVEFTKGRMSHAFSTINRLQKNKMIEMRLLEGPFRHLEGFWRFDDAVWNQHGVEGTEGACLIIFDMEFVLANKLLDLAVGPILHGITSQFISAFTKRAEQVYGKASDAH